MIYLFNSASRPLYRDNVLEVLAQPPGMLILHRYRAGGKYEHVDPTLVKAVHRRELRFIPSERHRLHRDPERVLLIYVDRYAATGYTYHPLRKGLIYSIGMRDDRLYFYVQLREFTAPATSASTFTESLRTILTDKRPPTLVPGNPNSSNDGQYAVLGSRLPECNLVTGEQAWLDTIKNISSTKQTASHVPLVFFRTEIRKLGSSEDTTNPRITGGAARIPIRKHETYELRVTYRSPGHSENRKPIGSISIEHGPSLQIIGSTEIPVRAEADDVKVLLASTRYTNDSSSFIALRAKSEQTPRGPRGLIAPTVTLPLLLRDPPGYVFQLLVAGLFFVCGTVLLGVEETPQWLVGSFLENELALRVLGGAGQVGALFWLFKLTGRKPV